MRAELILFFNRWLLATAANDSNRLRLLKFSLCQGPKYNMSYIYYTIEMVMILKLKTDCLMLILLVDATTAGG